MRIFMGIAALLAVALVATARDEKVPLDKVPAKIMSAVKAKFPKAKIESCEKVEEEGKTMFEFTLKDGDKKLEATFDAEGKFVLYEEVITEKEVPELVTSAFYKKYPDAKDKVTQIEKATRGEGAGAKVTYEFQFKKGKDNFEVVYDSQGKFVSEEKVGK